MDDTATMKTSLKVKPLANLKKSVKVKGKRVYIDHMKLFTRLMIIDKREVALQECLSYELTQLPASLFEANHDKHKQGTFS